MKLTKWITYVNFMINYVNNVEIFLLIYVNFMLIYAQIIYAFIFLFESSKKIKIIFFKLVLILLRKLYPNLCKYHGQTNKHIKSKVRNLTKQIPPPPCSAFEISKTPTP